LREIHEKAYAKLNLSLDVVGKRSDGYHDMRMVMQTVSLCDELRLVLRHDGKINVTSDVHFLPCDERNIAYKTAKAFFKRIDRTDLGVGISIKKHIPVCAGMGGGSSDGAAVLRSLNTLLGKPLTATELEELGMTLGSDIPFCICGGTSLAEGRGEILTGLTPLSDCHIVICKPRFSVSTPDLFKRLDSCDLRYHPDTPGLISALDSQDLSGVSRRMFNVFEDVLPPNMNKISEIKSLLLDKGALGAVMTGTGSAVFGIFDNKSRAYGAKAELQKHYRDVYIAVPKKKIGI